MLLLLITCWSCNVGGHGGSRDNTRVFSPAQQTAVEFYAWQILKDEPRCVSCLSCCMSCLSCYVACGFVMYVWLMYVLLCYPVVCLVMSLYLLCCLLCSMWLFQIMTHCCCCCCLMSDKLFTLCVVNCYHYMVCLCLVPGCVVCCNAGVGHSRRYHINMYTSISLSIYNITLNTYSI